MTNDREQLDKCLLTEEELLKLGKNGAFMVPVPRRVATDFRQENPQLYWLKVWTW